MLHNNNNNDDDDNVNSDNGNHSDDIGAAQSELREPLLSASSPDDSNSNNNSENEDALLQSWIIMTTTTATSDNNDDGHHEAISSSSPNNQKHYIAMLSNFSTSYNVVNISLVLPILEVLLLKNDDASGSDNDIEDYVAAVASSLLAGMIVGQVLGGVLGDTATLGHLGALRLVMVLQVAASLASSLLVPVHFNADSGDNATKKTYVHLALWRFVLGVGAGGVYPLAAALSAEEERDQSDNQITNGNSADEHINDDENHHSIHPQRYNHAKEDSLHRVVLTFSMQGVGFWTVSVVAVILLHTLHSNLNLVWRLLLGLGGVPGLILLYGQWKQYYANRQYRHLVVPQQVVEDSSTAFQQENTTAAAAATTATNEHDLAQSTSNGDCDATIPDQYRQQQQQKQKQERPSHARQEDVCSVESIRDIADSDGDIGTSILDSNVDLQTQEDGEDGPPFRSNDANALQVEHENWWHAVKDEPDLCNKLLGTAVTWFLFDVLFYGNTLFEPIVLEAAFGHSKTTDSANNNGDGPNGDDSSSIQLLRQAAMDSLLLTSIALPGYAVAGYWIGRTSPCGIEQTPRYVMVQGFGVMALLYLIIGYFWNELRQIPALLVILYGMTFFFANYGPNTTTFVMPSLVYSPNCRSTLNGLCAAAGKFGAWTGATLFEPAADKFGDATIMMVCSCVAVLALGLTKAFVPVSPMMTTTTVAHLEDVDRPEARERVGLV